MKPLGYVWDKKSQKKARVNWYRNGKLGLSYVNEADSPTGFANVRMEKDVEFRYGKIEPQVSRESVKDEDYESLKERLEKLRAERKQFGKRKSRSKKKKKKSKKKKKQTPEDIIEDLKGMDKEILEEALGGGEE